MFPIFLCLQKRQKVGRILRQKLKSSKSFKKTLHNFLVAWLFQESGFLKSALLCVYGSKVLGCLLDTGDM